MLEEVLSTGWTLLSADPPCFIEQLHRSCAHHRPRCFNDLEISVSIVRDLHRQTSREAASDVVPMLGTVDAYELALIAPVADEQPSPHHFEETSLFVSDP